MKRRPFIIEALILASIFAAAQPPGTEKPGPTSGASPESTVPQRVRLSRGTAQRLLIKTVPPKYPKDARHARVQGVVNLKARIDKNGNVEDVTVLSGEPALSPAAMEAVRQWKYKPYILNGEPVAAEFDVSINFSLAGN